MAVASLDLPSSCQQPEETRRRELPYKYNKNIYSRTDLSYDDPRTTTDSKWKKKNIIKFSTWNVHENIYIYIWLNLLDKYIVVSQKQYKILIRANENNN